ncbi:MAG: hypothetical protein ABSH47_26085, partial [Bryobacteraceae bacterium]
DGSKLAGNVAVSIHAPRAGRDAARTISGLASGVSIHAPRAGRDRNHYKLTNYNHLAGPQRGPRSQRLSP